MDLQTITSLSTIPFYVHNMIILYTRTHVPRSVCSGLDFYPMPWLVHQNNVLSYINAFVIKSL